MHTSSSMTAGELIRFVQDNNPDIKFIGSEAGQVGAYYNGEHIGGLTRSGTLPARTIIDTDDVIVCRGWLDFLAHLWRGGYLVHSNRLVRLMGGQTALDSIDLTGHLSFEGTMYYPGITRHIPEQHEWMTVKPSDD